MTLSGEPLREIRLSESVGSAIPRTSGGYVLGTASGFTLLDSLGRLTHHFPVLGPLHRMNDAKVGPDGAFWSGSCQNTFAPAGGRLWRMDTSGQVTWASRVFTQPNGLAWDVAGKSLFLVDSKEYVVLKVPFSPGSMPEFREAETFLDASSFIGEPDGMVIDINDNVWIAEYGAGVVSCFSQSGELIRRVATPTRFPTSLTFAGSMFNRLLVTSARQDADLTEDDMSGRLFLSDPLEVPGTNALAFDDKEMILGKTIGRRGRGEPSVRVITA